MIAIIKTGGKQYLVKKGDKLKVEKLSGKEGSTVALKDVLFAGDEKAVTIGAPTVKSAAVEAKIIKHGKGKKVTIIKHKAKKRYKKKQGHRQLFTEIEITKIS